MIMDKELEFSLEQAETTQAAHDSTNIIDLGAAGDAYGQELYFQCFVDGEAFGSGGSATLQVKLITDSAIGFATAPVTLYDSGAIAVAALDDLYEFGNKLRIPKGVKRFLKVTYTIGTTTMDAGKITARLVKEHQTNEANV